MTEISKDNTFISFYNELMKIPEGKIMYMAQNGSINGMIHAGRENDIIFRTNDGRIDFKTEITGFSIEVVTYSADTKKRATEFLDFLNMKAFTQHYATELISFTLQEYADFVGRKPTSALHDELVESIRCLENLKIQFKPSEQKKKRKDHLQIPVLTSVHAVKGSKFAVIFNSAFFSYLSTAPVMPVNVGIYELDKRKFKYAELMGRYIMEQYRINYKNPKRMKGGALMLTVQSIWESDPTTPTYEEISQQKRNYSQKIKEPFERTMNELARVMGFAWQYCAKNGQAFNPHTVDYFYHESRVKIYLHGFEVFLDVLEPVRKRTKKPLTIEVNGTTSQK